MTMTDRITVLEKNISEIQDQLLVIQNKINASTKLYAEAISNFKIQAEKLREKATRDIKNEQKSPKQTRLSKKKTHNK